MESVAQPSSFGGSKKGVTVVPVATCEGDQDAAEGGASVFGRTSFPKEDQASPLKRGSSSALDVRNETSADFFSPEDSRFSPIKSAAQDASVSYGRQQSRLAAQLASKSLRRPSQMGRSISMSMRMDHAEKEEGDGPWGALKKDKQSRSLLSRLREGLNRTNQFLLIRPGSYRLQLWMYVCVSVALLSGWEIPFHVAFYEPGGLLRPYYDWVAIVEFFATAVFLLDFLIKFFVAYIDTESAVMVTSRAKIAQHYASSWKFYFDLLGWFPFDWIISEPLAASGASSSTRNALAWLKLLQLARMYRVFEFFADLDYRMVISQGLLLLTRNYTYVFYVTHWAACILYHIASQQNYSPNSWVGRNAVRFEGQPINEKYLLSLYFSISAFTGLGDGALFASTLPEAAFMIVYLLFNLFLGAYILSTVTMLVVKGDERSKQFRDRMSYLEEFSKNHDLPDRLQSAMHEHLEVTFNTEQLDDERVLGIYPTTIRRKVLRHLYLQPVKDCYLFRGCKQRFLDALLTAARVELFMPAVQLMIEGDNVTELNIIVSGDVMVAEAGINVAAAFSQFASTDPSTHGSRRFVSDGGGAGSMARRSMSAVTKNASLNLNASMRNASMSRTTSMSKNASVGRSSMTGSIKDLLMDGAEGFSELAAGRKVVVRYSSDALAEVPFFTDVPSNETIMSQTVVRVLSLPKSAWESIMEQFPQQARLVLANMLNHAELELAQELHEASDLAQMTEEELRQGLQQMRDKRAAEKGETEQANKMHELLPQPMVELLTKLDDVRAVVRAHVRKVDQLRTFEFLGCASDGDVEKLRVMLNQGISPNSADYDGRTGLMLAAAAGHEAVVRLLLDGGAKSDQLDAFGNSAMAEAVKNSHDEVIDILLSYGATLAMDAMTVASVMCTAVFEGDLVKLRRLLRSGAPPDACDYDKRSALHIAGAEGNLAAVKLLIEEGGADPNFQDRWGNTALDEARRVGATPVVVYLEGLLGAEQLVGSGQRYRQQVATDFLTACSTGDLPRVRYITHNSHPGCIFTGLVLAASKGFKDVVELLLAWVPIDLLLSEGHMALVEAARMGHCQVVNSLRTCGLNLADSRDAALLAQARAAVQSVDVRAVAAMLAAGWDLTTTAHGNGALLHAAAATGSLELVRRLVEDGSLRPDVEDAGGKTPAAIADAAKLDPVADYLRWATTTLGSCGPSQPAQGQALGLAAAAVARFGRLPDYSDNDTHEEASHGIVAPESATARDEDDDVPHLLVQIGQGSLGSGGKKMSPSAVASMQRQGSIALARQMSLCFEASASQGSFSRQASMSRSSILTKLTSMSRYASINMREGRGTAGVEMPGVLTGNGMCGGDPSSERENRPRRNRRASLTNFLMGHRAEANGPGTGDEGDASTGVIAFTGVIPSSNSMTSRHKDGQPLLGKVTGGGGGSFVSRGPSGAASRASSLHQGQMAQQRMSINVAGAMAAAGGASAPRDPASARMVSPRYGVPGTGRSSSVSMNAVSATALAAAAAAGGTAASGGLSTGPYSGGTGTGFGDEDHEDQSVGLESFLTGTASRLR